LIETLQSSVLTQMANCKILVAGDLSEFSEKGAALFMEAAERSVHVKGWFAAALSGGSTPRPVHRRLIREPYLSGIPWDRTHLFWVDERMLDYSDVSSNFGTARQDLLRHVPIPGDHIHPMPVSGPLKTRADRYESELRLFHDRFGKGGLLFDLVFLGLGADGHVASLFPETIDSETPRRWTTLAQGGDPKTWRLSLTFEAINATRHLCFLVSGRQKASIVARVILNPNPEVPAQRIHPQGGEIVYLLDREAATLLGPALEDPIQGPGDLMES